MPLNQQHNIILIDDDHDILMSYQDLLQQEGYRVHTIADPREWSMDGILTWNGVVILDVQLPHISGLQLLEQIIAHDAKLPVIMVTGHGDVPMAVEAVQKGAVNFLEKPLMPQQLLAQVEQNLQKRTALIAQREWQQQTLNAHFIGESEWIKTLRQQLQTLAETNLPVFLYGENGTGRTLAADHLHKLGSNNTLPMWQYDGLSESLLEQYWQKWTSGTLLIHNIHHFTPLEQQRLLQQLHQYPTLRLIVISSLSLPTLMTQQQIISELAYLLIYTQIELRPLNQHNADIAPIFMHYVKQTCQRLNRPLPALDKKLMKNLLNKQWIGNVTELINVAQLYASGLLSNPSAPELTDRMLTAADKNPLEKQINEYERKIIDDALRFYQGCLNDVANYLDIPRKKLYLRMQKYGLDKKDYKI